MKRLSLVTALNTILTLPGSLALAQEVPAISNGRAEPPNVQYASIQKCVPALPTLSEDTVKLNPKEQRGVALADQWKNRSNMPFMGDDGSVQFIYGSTLPSVVCAPLFACDVALQPGEVVQQVLLGDSSRWKVCPGTSGSGANTVSHLVIKPSDVGLSTNLIVHTDRRSYNIRLVSKKDQWMPLVSFSYPDESQTQWAAYQEQQQQRLPAKTVATNADLNFNYRIKGDSARWKPIRVYSDKSKTYIQFPATVKNDQTPALVILDPKHQEQLVNYRMLDDRYVVDLVIHKAALIRGVGKSQERIEILREGG